MEGIILKSTPSGDKLSLIARNCSARYIRSAYFQAKVLDDTGDVVSECQCVYQGVSIPSGINGQFPVEKEFDLKTELAYKVDLTCEKVAFEDDEVWRNDAGNVPFTIPAQASVDETSFPRFKYITTKFTEARKKVLASQCRIGLSVPLKKDGYWICDCGQPVPDGKVCPCCGDTWENLETAFSQKYLQEIQQAAVKGRAAKRVEELAYLAETARSNKEKADNRVKEIQAIVTALKAGPSGQSQPNHKEELADERAKIQHLTDLLNGFDEISAKSLSLQQKRTELESKKTELLAQRAKLGLFAGKEKSRIDNEVSEFIKQIIEIESQIVQVEEKLEGYSAKDILEQDLINEEKIASALEVEIAQIEANRSKEEYDYSFDDAFAKYLAEPDTANAVDALYPSAKFIPAMYRNENSVMFGRFIQEPHGVPEPIEWQVLTRESNRMLLISKCALDCLPFDGRDKNIWANCWLKKWLNEEFYDTAFTSNEQKAIADTDVAIGKIFLLSVEEAKTYFESDIVRQSSPTAYAYRNTLASYGGRVKGKCLWWLRSPGKINHSAAFVAKSGSVNTSGDLVGMGNYGVRPAMWVSF